MFAFFSSEKMLIECFAAGQGIDYNISDISKKSQKHFYNLLKYKLKHWRFLNVIFFPPNKKMNVSPICHVKSKWSLPNPLIILI